MSELSEWINNKNAPKRRVTIGRPRLAYYDAQLFYICAQIVQLDLPIPIYYGN